MLSALYDFCRDQGSIIGGLLALAAGYLVFRGARRAADRQVSAAHAQTEASRQQNRDLRNEGRPRQAQDGIVAAKLLASVPTIIRNDVDNLKQLLDQPRYAGTTRELSRPIIGSSFTNPRSTSFGTTEGAALTLSVITCGSMPGCRRSRAARFMRSTSCKMNCRSSRIFSRFWSRPWRVTPLGTICFWKPRNRLICPRASPGYAGSTGFNLRCVPSRAASSTAASVRENPGDENRADERAP